MQKRGFWVLAPVTDDALEHGLIELLQAGGRTEARVLAHLAEVEERRLHLSAGFGSLFEYCLKRLGLSEDEACRRITAARLARRFPVIFELIEQRRMHLTGVGLVRHFLTRENHCELLGASSGKSRREIEALLATRFPKADVDSFVRRLPQRSQFSNVDQRSAETFRIQLNASKQLKEKLELACDLLSHAEPQREFASVIERALDLLIEKTERARFGTGSKPRRPKPRGRERESVSIESLSIESGSLEEQAAIDAPTAQMGKIAAGCELVGAPLPPKALVVAQGVQALALDGALPTAESAAALPAPGQVARSGGLEGTEQSHARAWIARATRREVAVRDGDTCSFVGRDGHRCGARAFLQLHHERAWARGGGDEAGNLRWFCAAHNRLAAERDFGREFVTEAIRRQAG